MKVTYNGESKKTNDVKGNEIDLEKSKVYNCMEKEYHSGLFVRIVLDSGAHVKVKRSELQKV
ncbi:MAG: hypothetical protein GY850_39450 [bacterium]|nr:hypothetical protein [bacterium]